ncbi:MAG: glycosyltransferase family 2 protein [Clostridia bacterium]|nr:glycosyltransferase family 2 protein [Clostridia bacterium]
MASVTAIVLTLNEEKNIETCIRRLRPLAERVVVVDSGSTDGTVALAKRLGAEVLEHTFIDYSHQFNWALENAGIQTEWVMRVDADEFYTPELNNELETLLQVHAHDDVNGILTESRFYFMGRRIDHGGSKKRKIVVFRNGCGSIEKRRMDEHTIVPQGRVIEAKHRFDHMDYKDLHAFVTKLAGYAEREADDYFAERDQYRTGAVELSGVGDEKLIRTRIRKYRLYYRLPPFLRCWMLFIYAYIFRLGFLDGREGFIYQYLYQRWYRTLVDATILEREKQIKASKGV